MSLLFALVGGVLATVLLFTAAPKLRLGLTALVGLLFPSASVAGVNLSHGWSLAMLPSLRSVKRSAIPGLMWGLLGVQLVSLIWSPDPGVGLNRALQTLFAAAALTMALNVGASGNAILRSVLICCAPVLLVQAVSVAVFLFAPALEAAYLRSGLGSFFLGAGAERIFADMPNNVLDPSKSGGFLFVNANVASMVLGSFGLGFMYFGRSSSQPLATLFGVGLVLSSCLTGSKTAWLIVGATALVLLLAPAAMRRFSVLTLGSTILILTAAAIIGAPILFSGILSAYADSVDLTWGIRTEIWGAAGAAFLMSPVLGLGFGGWSEWFAPVASRLGLDQAYPPHNFVIAGWAESGVAGALLNIAIVSALLVTCLRYAASGSGSVRSRVLASAALMWPAFHALADNTAVFGTLHTVSLLGALLAVMVDDRAERVKVSGSSSGPGKSSTGSRILAGSARAQRPELHS